MAPSAKKKTTKASRDAARLKDLKLVEQILTGENQTLRKLLEDLKRELGVSNTEVASLRSELESRDSQLKERDSQVASQARRLEIAGIQERQLSKLVRSLTSAGAAMTQKFAESELESGARGDDILMLVRLLSSAVSGKGSNKPESDEEDLDFEEALKDILGAFSSR